MSSAYALICRNIIRGRRASNCTKIEQSEVAHLEYGMSVSSRSIYESSSEITFLLVLTSALDSSVLTSHVTLPTDRDFLKCDLKWKAAMLARILVLQMKGKSINEHTPVYYVSYLWNSCEEER